MAVNILLKRSATASKRPVGASMAFGELNLNYDAATGGLFYKNSNGNVVKVGPCQVSATAPNSSPAGSSGNSAGEFWFDTSTQTLKLYDGTSWVEAGGMVQGVTGTAPITVDNSDPLNPIIGASAASTTAPGVVQLNDTTSSSSTTEALTANQGRILQTQIDALIVSSNLTFAGTIDASTGDMVTVSTEGAAAGFAIGDPLPTPGAGNTEYFVIVTVPGTMTPPGGSAQECHQGDWWLSDGTIWNFLDVGYNAPYATTAVPGVVQLATDAEVQAGVNTDHAVTPSGLQSKVSDSVVSSSSTSIASSLAVKDAYDAGFQGQTDAAAAQSTANQAVLDAAAAQSTADQAVLDAAAAQSSANAAQADATQALSDAAAAQATADGALQRSGGILTGNVYVSSGTTLSLDMGSFLDVSGTANLLGTTNLEGPSYFGAASYAYFQNVVNFEGTSTVNFAAGSATTVDGSFTFNTAPTFPAGVDIGAAAQVTYDNAASGLAASNVQDAIDEIVAEYVPNSSFTAAGDLLVGTGAGTYSPLPVGTTDQILAVGAGGTLEWVDNSSGDVTSVSGSAPITVDNTDPQNPIVGIDAATTASAGAVQLNDTVTSTSDTEAATANAVKTAYDAAVAAQGDATQALSDAAAAQATADAALPKAGGTMTGNITFQDAGEGVVFNGGSSITGISNSVSTTSSTTAASSTAVKLAYDTAVAAAAAGDISGISSDTVIFVNSTDGSDVTGQRGTTKAFRTITAALAAAQESDTIFLSPGSFTENVTLNKGVNMIGTMNDQALTAGTRIVGNFSVGITGAGTRNWAISHVYFISTNSTAPFTVTNNSFGAGGISTVNNCTFTQQTSADPTQYAVVTTGTWTRSLYFRECTFDGNFHHNAGTAAGASGYVVIDRLLGVGNSGFYNRVTTGTVEFRNPSNSLSSVLQTGGVALINGASAGITPSGSGLNSVFGSAGFSYKGSAASAGTGTVYFSGECQGTGKVEIGANLVYGYTGLIMDPANLTVNVAAIPYTTAVPSAANAQTMSQQRPRLDLLKSTSSVAAANQLATVVDSATGAVYTVASMDAGTY